ncbi:hypothetical protein [Burkholderia metallica]|uniref:hypothetical protein n=1 Tax=Burkholderia metallica TaxID=488729 RepID=UPI00384D10FA
MVVRTTCSSSTTTYSNACGACGAMRRRGSSLHRSPRSGIAIGGSRKSCGATMRRTSVDAALPSIDDATWDAIRDAHERALLEAHSDVA